MWVTWIATFIVKLRESLKTDREENSLGFEDG
jgi:hypothetical protein